MKKQPKYYKASLGEIFSILFKNSKNLRVLFPLELILVIIDGFLSSLMPVILKYVVDGLQPGFDNFIQTKLTTTFLYCIGISIGWYFSAVGQHYLKEKISSSLMINVQLSLYTHLQNLSLDFYQNTYIGEIANRLTNDIYQSIKELYLAFMHIVWLVAIIVPAMITMAGYSLPFFGIFFMFMVIFLILLKIFLPVVRYKERSVQDQRGKINAKITEFIYSILLIKSFAKEHDTSKMIYKESNSFLSKTLSASKVRIVFYDMLSMSVSFLIPNLMLCFGVLMRIEIGKLVAFYTYWFTAGNRIRNLLDVLNRIFSAIASFDRIVEFFNKTPLIRDKRNALPINIKSGKIEFRNVTFSYPLSRQKIVLNNINFIFKPKMKIGIVGKSGAGKSSILNLIIRFYDPDKGQILIDNTDIKKVQQKSLRQQIGTVMQDTYLLNGTIKENMQFIKSDVTDKEIIEALSRAQIWDLIKNLPDKLDTVIGEKGIMLSGGQKQRLGIARVFLLDPPVLLFDEATSAVDVETEKKIYKTIEPLLASRTSLIITHRLSTILDCDLILVLDNGKIIDTGSHEALYRRCESYRILFH